MSHLTTALVDAGVTDYAVESAMAKIAGTEYAWYLANRALQLEGGEGYMRSEPYELILRDIRIFPIFEDANDVLRWFVALSALKPLADELSDLGDLGLGDLIRSLGTLAEYAIGRVRRTVAPASVTRAHPELDDLAKPVAEQVARLRSEAEGLLRRHGKDVQHHGMAHRRLCNALSDVFAQIAVLSRVTAIFEEQGVQAPGQEAFIAGTFCTRAAARTSTTLDRITRNDDDRMHSIARLAYKRGAYGYALFED